ncbi:hypothetical protein HXX01_02775 [Candidatus Nomurabacteria bacterium]|nr:hypothetical protein [Candidatus Nomurabacteria bacterium]
MIYILVGGDTKNKNFYIKELTKNSESFFVRDEEMDRALIMSYSYNVNLFNISPAIIMENVLSDKEVNLRTDDLEFLKKSGTIFIFKEDKLLKTLQDKYKKYAEIKTFEDKKVFGKEKFNVFSITDAYVRKDKIGAWSLYNEAIKKGVEPEAIAGVLFWKIKTLLLANPSGKIKDDLKKQSSNIISLYHKAHRGETDLSIGIEQFILTSLTSK